MNTAVDPVWARDNMDSEAMHTDRDPVNGDPLYLGLCCLGRDGAFLTMHEPDASQQVYVSRAQLEWMMRKGIPAWLAEMDRS